MLMFFIAFAFLFQMHTQSQPKTIRLLIQSLPDGATNHRNARSGRSGDMYSPINILLELSCIGVSPRPECLPSKERCRRTHNAPIKRTHSYQRKNQNCKKLNNLRRAITTVAPYVRPNRTSTLPSTITGPSPGYKPLKLTL